jgi:hypothetical protein
MVGSNKIRKYCATVNMDKWKARDLDELSDYKYKMLLILNNLFIMLQTYFGNCVIFLQSY